MPTMTRTPALLFVALGLVLGGTTAFAQQPARPALRVLLNEIQPSAMSAPQYCMLVFDDHSYHSEKADIKHGADVDRAAFQGKLSDTDWNALIAIIDSKEFSDLKIPRTVPPPVMQDTHPYTISVARGNDFQNMEFLDSKSLKPYEPQVKPLLQWWKSVRGRHGSESSTTPDARCALDSTHGIIALW
jgi:hypothetical protein